MRNTCTGIVLLLVVTAVSACGSEPATADDADRSLSGKASFGAPDEEAPRWDGASATGEGSQGKALGPRSVEAHSSGRMPLVTLPGFRMLANGRSRVFVEVAGEVPMSDMKAAGLLKFRFKGVRVPERVNRLALPTVHFPTPVGVVRLVQVDNDAELVIELRTPADPEVHVERKGGGMVLSADFPSLEELQRAREQAAKDKSSPAAPPPNGNGGSTPPG